MKSFGSILYTDGACSGNPGPGGWGSVFFNSSTQLIFELGDHAPVTTNNRMEMTAIIEGLKLAFDQKVTSIRVLTDSTYVIRGYTQWRHGWRKRGWTTAEGQSVSNKDLWLQLEDIGNRFKIHWQYVRGHQGTPGNERVDEIAVAFSKRNSIHLDQGLSPQHYHFDIFALPAEEPLPEMKSQRPETRQFFYVSLVNGTLTRHTDWGSCERTVKGQSKAQFKKVSSENEVQEILKKWGYSDGN